MSPAIMRSLYLNVMRITFILDVCKQTSNPGEVDAQGCSAKLPYTVLVLSLAFKELLIV